MNILLTLILFSFFLSPILSNSLSKRLLIYSSPSISTKQKNVILSLTNIAENSQINFAYNYAENIGDGRGITFGIIGFTSGTYDGTELIERVNELDSSNVLSGYLPAFQSIDNSPHPDGKTDDVTGLSNFIEDFNAHGADTLVKQAHLEKLTILYWNPSISKATEIGAKYALTMSELYDICVNHGADGDSKDKGLKQLVQETIDQVGAIGQVDEKVWLNALYDVRKAYMESDPTWAEALDRMKCKEGFSKLEIWTSILLLKSLVMETHSPSMVMLLNIIKTCIIKKLLKS